MKKKREGKIIRMDEPFWIKFNCHTARYGRAEFDFDLVYERTKIKRLIITPRQQITDLREIVFTPTFRTGEWWLAHYDVEAPRIWQGGYCKYHKAFVMTAYVPDNSRYVLIDYTIGKLQISFHPNRWDSRYQEIVI